MKCLTEDYISENGIIIPKDSVDYIRCSDNSSVWKYEKNGQEYVFKEFFPDRRCYCLKYDTYTKMRDLPLLNIIKPLESYKKVSNTHEKALDGYLMDYIPHIEEFCYIDYQISTLLENIRNLEKDIECLSNSNIIMHNVGPRNTLIGDIDHKLNVVDIDMYYYDRLTEKKEVLRQNRKQLFYLIRLMLFRGIIHDEDLAGKKEEIREFLKEYFNADETNESLYTRVENLFRNYETPKEFMLERKF